jgi:hypothetical protein
MRGGGVRTGELFSYVDPEDRVRRDHPLQAIRLIVNDALTSLEGEFSALYSPIGRPSIAPEKLQRPCFCRLSIRSVGAAAMTRKTSSTNCARCA